MQIFVNTTLVCASNVCGGCGRPAPDKGSYQSNGYPSWFPSSGYDRNNKGYSAVSQYPSAHEHNHPPSGYSSASSYQPPNGDYSSASGYQPPNGGYSSATAYQPPADGTSYYVGDKGYQGYPANKGDQNGFYDTGFKGYHNTWSDKGSGQYPGVVSGAQYPGMNGGYERVDYLDNDGIDTYARRGYKGDPGYNKGFHKINRVKKQSALPTEKKTS